MELKSNELVIGRIYYRSDIPECLLKYVGHYDIETLLFSYYSGERIFGTINNGLIPFTNESTFIPIPFKFGR
jgi:hypothetical protein